MKAWDCLVVGAGPAGATAAAALGLGGARVLLVESALMPRPKPCGGAMPASVLRLFESIGRDITHQLNPPVHAYRNLFDFDEEQRVGPLEHPVLLVDRPQFDLAGVEHALGSGAVEHRGGMAVRAVEENAGEIHAWLADGERLTARAVVIANGARSPLATSLGLNPDAPFGLAIDADVEVSDTALARESDHLTFNFGCVPGGYGWIFPKAGHLSCGVGGWPNPRRLGGALRGFLARSFAGDPPRAVRRQGHPIPLYAGRTRLATARACVVGDAASLVDPIMGEGIRYAVASGLAAADAVLAALDDDCPHDVRSYETLMHSRVTPALEVLHRLALPDYQHDQRRFYRQFILDGYSHGAFYSQLAALQRAVGSTSPAALDPWRP